MFLEEILQRICIKLKEFRQTVFQENIEIHETGCPFPVKSVIEEEHYVVKAY